MIEAVDLFRDKGTIDDLGIGAIRDGISDTLFPGTSTLHTRLRYGLFIVWILQRAAQNDTLEQMQWDFHDLERDFIDSLKQGMGEDQEGIIGRRAGRELLRMPSEIYWGQLVTWGIAERGLSVRDYFKNCLARSEQLRTAPKFEDSDTPIELTPTGLLPGIPAPPRDLMSSATFELRPEEAIFYTEAITRTCPGTLLAHLVEHRPAFWLDAHSAPEYLWAPELCRDLPADLQEQVDLAERFSLNIQGANLLYNLLLAEATTGGQTEHAGDYVAEYRNKLAQWAQLMDDVRPLDGADHRAIGQLMTQRRRTYTPATQNFLTAWFELARVRSGIVENQLARRLIRQRESAVKQGRARLRPGNFKALDAWSGASGVERIGFRWNYVRSHLQDIYDGLDSAKC